MKKPSVVSGSGGILYLHAVAVLHPKGVILFLGHSGSGKSTLSRLLSDHYKILVDDRIFIRLHEDNKWYLEAGYETKLEDLPDNVIEVGFDGDTTKSYPIHSIIRLFGSQENVLSPLLPIKTCEYLVDAIFEVDHQRKCRDFRSEQQWFKQVVQIAKQYPGWVLRFSLNKHDVLRLLQKL